MPVFTSIGLALGAAATSAFAVGAIATAVVGYGAYSAGKAAGIGQGGDDARIQAPAGTGEVTPAEAQTAAKKRAFRSGILFTSPGGLGEGTKTSSAKLR